MKTTKDKMMEPLKAHLNKELLKYTAGLYMFCPICNTVLDWKTVVIIDVWNAHGTKHHGQKVGCTKCFHPEAVAKTEAKNNIKLEITQYHK
jgi:hypothetical protein